LSKYCPFFHTEVASLENGIKTVIRKFRWTPEYVNSLYLDGADYLSLWFWYDDIVEESNELKKKTKK